MGYGTGSQAAGVAPQKIGEPRMRGGPLSIEELGAALRERSVAGDKDRLAFGKP